MATEREGRKRERERERGGRERIIQLFLILKSDLPFWRELLKFFHQPSYRERKKFLQRVWSLCLIGNLQWALSISRAAVKWLLVMHTGQAIARC